MNECNIIALVSKVIKHSCKIKKKSEVKNIFFLKKIK